MKVKEDNLKNSVTVSSLCCNISAYCSIYKPTLTTYLLDLSVIVDNKTNLKTGISRKKARQIFRKTNISYPLIRTRTCALSDFFI